MELQLLHLYPELMSLYGEYANLTVLRRHLEAMGVTVDLQTCSCEETPNFESADLIYMGAGTEHSQKAALTRLLHSVDALQAARLRGAWILFTGNAMELLGQSIQDIVGKEWQGLSLAGFTTVETERRSPVDVLAQSTLWEAPVVGFMNKCSTTHGIDSPLFSALALGFGNEQSGGAEGYRADHILATHITGPVLVKNPAFTNYVIEQLFQAKQWELPSELPTLPHEQEAYAVTLRELRTRLS